MGKTDKIIVSDIGASNVRFAVAELGENGSANIDYIEKYPRSNFPSFHDALSCYENDVKQKADVTDLPISLAIAGSRLNSESWQFSQNQWIFQRDERVVSTISDLEGFALGALTDQTHVTIRETAPNTKDEIKDTIIAVGTGLGLSYVQNNRAEKTHGGHMRAFGVTTEQNTIIRIIQRLSDREHMVVYEDVASGLGLVKLYQAVCIYNGHPVLFVTPEDIVEKSDPKILDQTLRLFHEFLGLFAHMALVYGHGYRSLYLGGGVIDVLNKRGLFDQQTFIHFLNQDAQKIVAQNIENCPIYLISDSNIALYGAARAVFAKGVI